MSNSTFLGQREIVWTAIEAIGTFLLFTLTFLLLMEERIRNWLFYPSLKVIDDSFWFNPEEEIDDENGNKQITGGSIQLQWVVNNQSLFALTGDDIIGLTTMIWFGEKDISYMQFSDMIIESSIFLPKNEKWSKIHFFNASHLPNGEYTLILQFLSQGKEVGRFKNTYSHIN